MKSFFTFLSFFSAACLASSLRNLQVEDFVTENLLFTQCSCANDVYETEEKVFFPQPFLVEGEDTYSCTSELNEFSDVALETGALFDFSAQNSALTTQANIDFFKNSEGGRGSFFFFFRIDFLQPVTEMGEFKIINVPELDFSLSLAVEAEGDNLVFVLSGNFGFVSRQTLNAESNILEIIIGEQEIPGQPRASFMDFVQRDANNFASAFTLLGGVPNEVQPGELEVATVELLSNPTDVEGQLSLISFQFGKNILTSDQLARFEANFNEFVFISDLNLAAQLLSLPTSGVVPNVIQNDVIETTNDGPVEVNLLSLFEEAVEGTVFSFEEDPNLEGEVLLVNETLTFTPSVTFIGEAVITVNVGVEDFSCGFDLDISFNVLEGEPDPVIEVEGGEEVVVIAVVSVVAIVAVVAAVGAVFFFKAKTNREEPKEEVKKEEIVNAI